MRQAAADFTELIRRTGVEGRISSLKGDDGWRRSYPTTVSGTRSWCGRGILAHNLTKIVRLTT